MPFSHLPKNLWQRIVSLSPFSSLASTTISAVSHVDSPQTIVLQGILTSDDQRNLRSSIYITYYSDSHIVQSLFHIGDQHLFQLDQPIKSGVGVAMTISILPTRPASST